MLYIDSHLKSQLEPYLDRDERLVWAGRPRRGIIFKLTDIFLIPFSLVWCGFAIFWTYMAAQGSILFALFGIPFVLVGLGLVFGRFVADALNRKNTIYGITTNRVVVLSGITKRKFNSVYIASLADIELSEKSDGSGTIFLGSTGFKSLVSSPDILSNSKATASIAYIQNVRAVYQQLLSSIKDRNVIH